MSQLFLTNYSIVVIEHVTKVNQKDYIYSLGNESLLRSEVFFSQTQLQGKYENNLFYVETNVGNTQFKMAIEFEKPILLRHKLSNKFLSYSTVIQDEENDSTVKLQLSGTPCYFKFIPCFQYQTKISTKIKFNEDIYLATQLSSAKLGYVSIRGFDQYEQLRPILGLNYKSKLNLHCYFEEEEQSTEYQFGQSVWLIHVQSKTFLKVVDQNNKVDILFNIINQDEQQLSIKGLWLIDAINTQIGGSLHFNQHFYFKSLSANKYLTFSKEFKTINGQKVYNITLESKPTEQSKFLFESLKGEQNKIKQGSYLKLKHLKSETYIGTRRSKTKQQQQYLTLITFPYFDDEDLFEIKTLDIQDQEIFRFIFSFRDELVYISNILARPGSLSKKNSLEILNLYDNILHQFNKLNGNESFEEIQEELGPYFHHFYEHLKSYRLILDNQKQKSQIPTLISKLYTIMKILCKQYKTNQILMSNVIDIFIQDIFKDFGAQELISQIFKNNQNLLNKVPDPLPSLKNKNIIKAIFEKILVYSKNQKKSQYWNKMVKVLELMNTLLYINEDVIDINQRLISTELFQSRTFDSLFFQIKAMNKRIKILHPLKKHWIQLDQVRDPLELNIVERIFKLFSQLCEDRNFISKSYIHNYLHYQKQNGVQILLTYLNISISPFFSNNLYSLITNCYIDSSPRINRQKPLSVLLFNLTIQKQNYEIDMEKSVRLHSALLNKNQSHFETIPFQISNLLTSSIQLEPSLNSQELDLCKQQLNERLNSQDWTAQLLKLICILIKLESYSVVQMSQIKVSLYDQIMKKTLPKHIVSCAMKILEQIDIYCEQLQIKKITTYLKYCFVQKHKESLKSKQVAYLLPNSKKIANKSFEIKQSQLVNTESESALKYRQQYNDTVQILSKLYPNKEMKKYLFTMFIQSQNQTFSVLSSIFSQIIRFNFPKLRLVRLLTKSIVMTGDQIGTFGKLFQLYKKMNHLNCISEHWLYSKKEQFNESKIFIEATIEFTNFMFQNYQLNSNVDLKFRKFTKLNINRQLLIHNMAIHEIVLSFLSSNYFILMSKTEQKVQKKQKQTFQSIFTFLYYFCENCNQNLKIVSKKIQILQIYRNFIQVGQTKLLILMYKNNQSLTKQVNSKIIDNTILKIIKNAKSSSNEQCQYNPQYIQFLLTIINPEKPIKKNIELIYKAIQKQSVFKKLLFLQQKNNQTRLSLQIQKFRKSPLKIPILYHKKVLKLINALIQNLQYSGTLIRNRLKQYLNIQDIFRLLCIPDIYSHNGILPELNFLLKKQLILLLNFYLDKNDSISKLYQSRNLQSLLDHFRKIFIIKPPKQLIINVNQQIMVPYMSQYKRQLAFDLENERDYYTKSIQQLLSKLYSLFQKIGNRQSNKNFVKIVQILQNINTSQLNQNHLLKNVNFGIDLINLKWRNFVDADEDNSVEQKYVKKTILQFLKHKQTEKQIQLEKQAFYQQLSTLEEKYFSIMEKFIKMAEEQQQLMENEESQQLFYEIIKQLAQYLAWTKQKQRHFQGLQEKVIISTLIGYVNRPGFDYNKQISRQTFFQILRIFVLLLEYDKEQELPLIFYNYFNQETSSYRFFICLDLSINQIYNRIQGEKIHEQINYAISQLSLCGQIKKSEIDKQGLKFIKLLCLHIPFTDFFRTQPYTSSVDFLQKIYNLFYMMVKRDSQSQNLTITITVVDIVEVLLDCMVWMINGCNETNQNYIIDTKFPSIVVEMLKKQKISNKQNKAEISKRDMLLQDVINFYQSNGISIKDILLKNIKFLDFNHIYLLNRLKLTILKLLHQCTIGNDRVLGKIKIIIPVELLKINLIWIYCDFKEQQLDYSQENITKHKQNWKEIVQEQKLKGTFIMIGFYFYIFIEYYKQQEKNSKEDEDFETIQDQEKQKQKIIKKFFSAIIDKEKKQDKMKHLQNEPFGKEMVLFYKQYYAAYKFYREKTLTIEAKVYDKLIKIYFPELPICDKLTEKMKQKLINEAQRISHQQKIKSLIEFQQQSYEIIDGQERYFKNLQSKSQILYQLTNIVKQEDNVFFIIWIINTLIVLNYLLYDYINSSTSFQYLLMYFVSPASFLEGFMLLLQLMSLFCGFVMLLNLIIKKIPLLIELFTNRYHKERQQNLKKGKQQESGLKSTLGYHLVSSIFLELVFDIYIILFSFLSIVHPFFAGFQLIYIISRIAIGQQIIIAIQQTAFQLLAAAGLLAVCIYIYAVITYIFFTDDVGYGGTCQTLFKCFLLIIDQSLKAGTGFFSGVGRDDLYVIFTVKMFCQIFYILFVQKVIFEIFGGTIIDKLSQLRQKSENTQIDQASNCYICGQERFSIDFQLQGFEDHVKDTHNKFNYIFYLYYLRRKKLRSDFGIEQHFIWKLREQEKHDWIPDDTSLLKEQKSKAQEKQEQKDVEKQYQQFFSKKIQQLKKMKQKMQFISTQLNEENFMF